MSVSHEVPLVLPSLRARMGDWTYYICFMRMQDIADRVQTAEDIHRSELLAELLQRQLTSNAPKIRDYLLAQKQRFFNAIVVGTYGGDPKWNPVKLRDVSNAPTELPEYLNDAIGVLTLSGQETLFAVDGQHRVVGIRLALDNQPSLGDEEVCTIFISGVTAKRRSEDEAGFERTRRVFTTLNRYAKPVSKRDIIALDEDDVIAIVTRRLVDEQQLFSQRISIGKPKSIPRTDTKSFTTIVALYDAMDLVLRDRAKRWTDFKRVRPSDSEIDGFYDRAIAFWRAVRRSFPPVATIAKPSAPPSASEEFRNRDGGHLLFRPVGLLICVRVIRRLMLQGTRMADAVAQVARAPMELAQAPWLGLLWDATNQRMLTAPENVKVAERIFWYGLGNDLSEYKTTKEELRTECAGLLKREIGQVKLRKFS